MNSRIYSSRNLKEEEGRYPVQQQYRPRIVLYLTGDDRAKKEFCKIFLKFGKISIDSRSVLYYTTFCD